MTIAPLCLIVGKAGVNTRQPASDLSVRTRRRTVLVAVLAMPLSFVSVPAVAQGPPPSPVPASGSTTSSNAVSEPTLTTAWEKAAKSGRPIEIPARFTETMKVWAVPDGKHLKAELHTRPIQLRNPTTQAWEPIDPTIVIRGGRIQATRVKTPLIFGGRGSKNLVSAAGEQGTSGLSVTRALPEPKISGNTVTYPDAVAPGADLVILAQAEGFVSQVVFRREPTGPVNVRLPLTLPRGTTFGKTPQGLPQLKDAKGRAKAAPIVLTAVDAKVEASPEEGRTSPVRARVETSGATSELVFSPDEKFLSDPAVTYPVTIAAASEYFGGGVPTDAFVTRNDPYNNHAAEGWLRAGTTSTSADVARVYLKFNTEAPELEGATVVDADLRMWNYKSSGPNGQLCGDPLGAGIVAARVTSPWTLDGTADSLDWYNQPSSTGTEGLNRAGYNYDAPASTWCAKDEELFHKVTGMARAWIEQDVPNHGLLLRAASETAAINWRQYYSAQFGGGEPYPGYRHPPALIVEYTPAPTVTEWVRFEGDDLPEFPTYEQAKAMESEPLDAAANWGLTNEEANELESAGLGVPYEISANRLGPLPDDVEVDPATMEPDEVPAGSLPTDETKPTVTDVRPAADSTGVPVGSTVTATFSEPVWEPEIAVKDPAGTVVQGTKTLDTTKKVLTFTPAQPLKATTIYSAEVSEAYDDDGNNMAPHSWRFTTEDDTTPPTVSTVVPPAQATGISVTTPVTVTFGEAVTDVLLTLKDPAGTAVTGTTAMDSTQQVFTFTPAQPLAPATPYTAEVSAAKDVAGNPMAGPYTWSFITGANPPAGLVAAYGMDEGAGTSVGDFSGHDNTGVVTAASWRDGKYGKALSFDGLSSWITVQDAASLRLTTGMTLSAWVNPTTAASTWRSVATKELDEGASYSLYAANGGGYPSGWVQVSPEEPSTVDGPSPLPVSAWSHLAITYDGAALRLFVNGGQVAETALSGGLHDDGGALRIGGNSVWGEYFSGLIDEVRVYNRAQTDAEIQTDMNTPIGSGTSGPSPTPTVTPTATPTPTPTVTPTPVPGLVAAYGMQEGTGTTVGDSSGQNNTGAATDTTWAAGKYGTSLSFNGSSSWVTVPHAASLRLRDTLTLSAWVRPAALGGVWRSVLMKENAEVGGVYGLYADSEYTAPSGWLQTAQEGGGLTGEAPLPLNQWSHLAVTYDGAMMTLHVNGAKVAQAPITGEVVDDGGVLRLGGNSFWGEFYSGLIDEVRVYNRVQTDAEIQIDMNTPIPAAPAPAEPRAVSAATPSIVKLAVSGDRGASGTTPRLTVWVSDRQGRPAKVEVEVTRQPDKLSKSAAPKGKRATGERPTWSGTVTGKAETSRHTLRIPAGKLRKGQQARWRARATVAGAPGAWSQWQTFTAGGDRPDSGPPVRTTAPAPSPPSVTAPTVASDPDTSGPFSYERMSRTDCDKARRQSPRPWHGWGWTVLKPYTGCYSRKLGWGDWKLNPFTRQPVSKCPQTHAVIMTANVLVYTNLGTKNGAPVVYGENDKDLTAQDISVWTSITDVFVEDSKCRITTAFDGLGVQVAVDAVGADGSSCTIVKGQNRSTTIGGLKSDGEDAFVFRSGGAKISNCTLRPKLYPPQNVKDLDPRPFHLWEYLATEQDPPTRKGDLPFVARCDTKRISFLVKVPKGENPWRGNSGGCRLLGADRVYTMYTEDSYRKQVAQHILFAFQHPQDTDPKVDREGKAIPKDFPGNYDKCGKSFGPHLEPCVKVPLTKRSGTERIPGGGAKYDSKNKSERDRYCKNLPGRGEGMQCDEYPFASSWEAIGVDGKLEKSTWIPTLNASLRYVTAEQNGAAGRDLSAFYARYRVLPDETPEGGLRDKPGNAFFVRIVEGPPPAPSS
ncbi:LamG-like jellyroll fold domain-containing protein [Streptosporangium sp. NPDC020145]|uniref:LamG-like jellyroll fold domain-containing protein n=1 Tax=Streptosporangium sp. NPDC020145 TaxID=3154694 RepID=UPI003437BDA9